MASEAGSGGARIQCGLPASAGADIRTDRATGAAAGRIRAVSEPVAASVLSDGTIRRLVDEGRIVIDPWDPSLVQPASVDVALGRSFRVFHNHRASAIDLRDPPRNLTEEIVVDEGEPFVIHPGRVLPRDHPRVGRAARRHRLARGGQVELGRLGLIVHATAGFVDPGWKGALTLELNNLTRIPIKLWPGLLIAQLSFMALDAPAQRPYGSRGAGQPLPGPGRGHGEPLRERTDAAAAVR